ncbi:CLUMA_CG000773, isoform A [Clunio marinus]|uniref:CLUMA_CG000773, isoform A n=1 Tax=Clunio marinus TaxID=568069 RepID=A0A1J1HG02_9DIPT|nr:CLUMA_CG000773, isoform A [Clunio marinus]
MVKIVRKQKQNSNMIIFQNIQHFWNIIADICAINFRRVLAEGKYDMENLRKMWNDGNMTQLHDSLIYRPTCSLRWYNDDEKPNKKQNYDVMTNVWHCFS